jgi:hypothetical protein
VSESQTLTGLSPSTTYHYRIEATNSGGTTFGADQTFTTSATSSKLVGNSSIASVTDDNPAGTAQAYKFTAGASGTSQTISFYVDSSNTATAGVLGIYSNNAGNPGTLKGKVSFTPQAGWNTVTLSGVSITSGTVYWLAELGTSGTLAYRDETGSSGGSEISGSSSLTTLPATWPVGAVSSSNSASEYVSG